MNKTEGQQDRASVLSPFDWTDRGHTLVRVCEALDGDLSDLVGFVKRVQSIEYGLSAETEFAAILSWLGRCSLVHRLDQDYFSSHSERVWRIPDLFVIFEHDGVRAPALIEVKTSKKENLGLKASYLEAMRRYANALSLPLLIAWKPRRLGFWLLVDPVHVEEKDGKSMLSLGAALKNNLLSTVAGDFVIKPKRGAGFFLEAKIVKKTRVTEAGYQAVMEVTNAEFRDAHGRVTKNLPTSLAAIMFSCIESVDEVTDSEVRMSFVTCDQLIHAQQVLRTAVALQTAGTDSIKWRHVARSLDRFLSREALHQDIQNRFGTFVQYQLFQHPQVWPSFLPIAWNALC